jgi:hypothetical protein
VTKVEVFITYLDNYGYYDGKDYFVHTFMNGQADGYILGIREMVAKQRRKQHCKLVILKDGREI